MSFRTWVEALASDPGARRELTERLAASPHPAFYWETAPVCAATASCEYTDIILESRALARVQADPRPFANCFTDQPVAVFDNRGRDARLVVPCPRANGPGYPHLAAFVRTAPADQIDALWSAVAREMHAWWRRTSAPVWLSTAGLGVYWLHIRLDSRPKYYRHVPFRRSPPLA